MRNTGHIVQSDELQKTHNTLFEDIILHLHVATVRCKTYLWVPCAPHLPLHDQLN
jgi:hypothetical protein